MIDFKTSSVTINASRTNGSRSFVDNQSTFVVGEGSNLHVGTLENTGAVIGKEGNSTFKIDSYVGKDIQNYDTMTTTGGSIGASLGRKPKITNVGFNQDIRDKQGITRNTVVGDVEITKAEGSPINRDLGKANEITKDTHRSTNINIESQTIEYATNPGKLKEDIGKAKEEINDIKWAIKKSIYDRGDDNRNFFGQLSEVRLNKSLENITGERLIGKTVDTEIAGIFKDAYKDLGYDINIIFSDPKNSPQLLDEKGKPKTGTAYVRDENGKKIKTIIINGEDPKNATKAGLIGTIVEEGSHVIGKVEGRQRKTGTDEKGLESTGRASNEYFSEKYKDDNPAISIQSDGKDYSNVDFGENVGDICDKSVNGCVKGHIREFISNVEPLQRIEKEIKIIENDMMHIAHNTKKYKEIIDRKGKKKGLEAMELEGFSDIKYKWVGPFGKKLFALYGASDEIRKEYLVPIKETGEDSFYEKRPWNKQKLIMDDYMPDEMYRLFNRKETISLIPSIIHYWDSSTKNKNIHEISSNNRFRKHEFKDFTTTFSEFTALGNTNLFTSSYGKVTKIKTSRRIGYNVNITILIQYKDTFDDVGNVLASGSQKSQRRELIGGIPFGIETRKKEIRINKQMKSLEEIKVEVINQLKKDKN